MSIFSSSKKAREVADRGSKPRKHKVKKSKTSPSADENITLHSTHSNAPLASSVVSIELHTALQLASQLQVQVVKKDVKFVKVLSELHQKESELHQKELEAKDLENKMKRKLQTQKRKLECKNSLLKLQLESISKRYGAFTF